MQSHILGHYPQVRFSGDNKWLFNPVLKKRFANRPEERVRLRYVEFLLRDTAVTSNRIGFEALVKAYARDNSLRADLVIYDKDIQPLALIECKSPRINLTGKTAEQAARYNQTLQAVYMMITNGIHDYWYKRADNQVIPTESHPFEPANSRAAPWQASYWTERGFLDPSLPDEMSLSAVNALKELFTDHNPKAVTYLNLPADISPVELNHYYRLVDINGTDQIALTVAASQSQTIVAAMLNRGGQNSGVLWMQLRDLFEENQPEVHRLLPTGKSTTAGPVSLGDFFKNSSGEGLKKLINDLIPLFD